MYISCIVTLKTLISGRDICAQCVYLDQIAPWNSLIASVLFVVSLAFLGKRYSNRHVGLG